MFPVRECGLLQYKYELDGTQPATLQYTAVQVNWYFSRTIGSVRRLERTRMRTGS
jgi:hypothetical protein